MSVKSIHFPPPTSDDMVRAILEGRKTVTWRVAKLKYSNTHLEMFTNKYGTRLIEKQNEEPGITTIKNPDGTTTHTLLACIEKEPPYRPGDILCVRETWYYETFYEDTDNAPDLPSGNRSWRYVYKADNPDYPVIPGHWRPSIHMPREAARIFLRVTNVRVERLQDITHEGITKEGIVTIGSPGSPERINPFFAFSNLWDSTIKPADRALYGWEANPWVFVISFERISKDEALQ